MFGNILSCISMMWELLCNSMSSTTTQTQSSSPSDSMPSTTSQTQSSTVSCSTRSQTPSSSTSFSTRWDVFLSFRGEDTRFNFTGHLYQRLHDHGINTFKDDPALRGGEVISDALLDAIRNSKTYIVVLSQNYASSSSCLDELAEILNCHKTMHRCVIPVFFNIDPPVVRHQTGSFKQAFKKHQNRFRGEKEKLENWRLTLTEVANFSGHHISEDRSEADVINDIVDELLLKINPKTLDVAKYPVGLDFHVEAITRMISRDTNGVIKFGIYGMGGVGKTTLAKALFNQFVRGGRFKGSCFLPNVRESSGTLKGLESLQKKLINDVLKGKNIIEVDSVEEGAKLIKDRICSEKVLVLIDDIYDLEQYESLAGPFASGSVVIITTRDEEMLDKVSVEPTYRYMLNVLDYAQSWELFTQYAFEKAEPTNNLLALCEDILGLAGGLPLALKIFGSYLSTKKKVGWKSYIETLQKYPNSTIEQKLLISLDALESDDRMLKKIFVDIACFYIGWKKEKAVKVLETYYSHADEKMDTLKKRCLLTVNKEELEMHDLLRDVGWNVARNKAPDEPGKYSRLWLPEDIEDVLKNHTGTEAIEGIIPHNFQYRILEDALERKSFSIETFKWMRKLRFLYFRNVNLTGSFKQMLGDLRVLHWDFCPLKCLPSDFYPEKLVILELPRSNMKTMWDLNMVSQGFGNLKTLNMSSSTNLVTTPDFIKLPSLETLNLMHCGNLEEVHISIGSLARLDSLNLRGCHKLRSLPDTICNLRALKVLTISYCSSLEALPIQLGNIESLTELNAEGPSISKLPDSIGHLTKLHALNLNDNRKLETLPDTICNLRSVEYLDLYNCISLEALPTEIGNIESLKKINLWGPTVSKLPDSIGSLTKLVELDLSNNNKLETLPDTICNLSSLETLSIERCDKLETLPYQLWKITSLRKLDANLAKLLKKLPDIGSSQVALSLQELHLSSSALTALPSGFSQLSNLQSLDLSRCNHLLSIPKLPPNLKSIQAYECKSLERLPISNLKHLEELELTNSRGLTYIQGLEDLISIKRLLLRGCRGLTNKQHLTKSLFKGYSEFGHQISVYTEFLDDQKSGPDWILESPYWTSGEDSESTKLYAYLLPNESHSFMGIILCFKGSYEKFGYSVKNTTSGFIWRSGTLQSQHGSLMMVIVPKSIFSVRDEDHRIELTWDSYVKVAGIHLLYKTDTKMIEAVVEKHVIVIDALKLVDPVLHDIFLDIACFFIGWEEKKVVQILETYYTNVLHSIDILKKKCLLKINDRDELAMDDLLKHMGRKIARNNSPDEPGEHSRLWLLTDLFDVLKNLKETKVIEGIVPHQFYFEDALREESFTSETFRKMSKLRFLYLMNVHLTGSFEQTFEDLRWLCWDDCPLKCLPAEFYPPKLVILELPRSNIITMWELNMVPYVFDKLKTLDMSYSEDLTTTPDFTKLPYLETLILNGCKSLEEVHISIGSLVRLVSLDLDFCVNLRSLPDTICNLKALKVLSIGWCSNLEALPLDFGDIKSLTKLNARGLTVSKLPKSVQRLSNLVELRLGSNKNLETLPDAIYNLRSLEILDIYGCEKLEILLDQLFKVTSLRELIVGGATLLKIPPHIEPSQITLSLRKLDCSGIVLTALPSSFSQLSNLENLNLKGCMSMERLPNLSNLKQLEYLNLEDCSGLTEIQGLQGLTSIRTLHLKGCNSSLLTCILTESFFQMCSQFGHPIQICSTKFPYWISQSSEYESTMYSGSTMYLDLPPNVSHKYLGMILCITSSLFNYTSYSVKKTSTDFIWRGELKSYSSEKTSLMVIVPRSTFDVENGADRIKLIARDDAKSYGIHLLYKTEEYNSTTVNED